MIAKRKSVIGAVSKVALRRGLVKRLRLPVLAVLLAVIGSMGTFSFSLADSFNTSVDFTQTTMTLANMPFSSTISTYNAYNTDITQDAAQRAALGSLHAGYYRVPPATVTVTNNVLDLTFSSVVGPPQLAAIEVVNPGTPQTTVLSS
jgi:hypothetical protein